ncbi:unnamed protein product, partial [marine sediment metagenome]
NNGGENPDDRRIEWGTSTGVYTGGSCSAGAGGEGPFSCGMTGLPTGTTIYCRAKAHNSAGWGYGGEVTFLTKPGETTYDTMVGSPTGWVWEKCDYEVSEKCPVGLETSWAWKVPTLAGPDKTPQGSPTLFNWGSE